MVRIPVLECVADVRLRNTIQSYYRPLHSIDVILIGHSMGGSLASEAIILLSRVAFQHNIIGIIGLDVPFLGVHPHVVTSGVTGLMKSGGGIAKPPEKERLNRPTAERSTSSLSLPESPYSSETARSSQTSITETIPPRRTPSPQPRPKPEKKSDFKETIAKTVQAIYKNRHDLGGAAPRYLWSHIEYGHILLDPTELKAQYDQLRLLPVNFANFYTCVPNPKKREARMEECFVRYLVVLLEIWLGGKRLRCLVRWMNRLLIVLFLLRSSFQVMTR